MANAIATLREDLRASRILLRAGWHAAISYRLNFLMTIIGGIALQGTQLLFIGVLLAKFSVIHDWRFHDVAFLFAMRLAAHAFYVVPFGALFSLDQAIQQGDVDRYMLRPAGIYLQVITRYAPLMALGDMLLGFAALAIFAPQSSVHWTPTKVLFLIVAVVGGGLVETGIQTFFGALSFRMTSTTSLRILADDTITRFSAYPLTMFNRWGFLSLTFAFPMAFIAYLPTAALLDRTAQLPIPAWIVYASPLGGLIVFVVGLAFFNRMTRSYNSPGS
ncbi:ABC transporter permease [Kribbella solani]|uniref:ABC transporter permease n=1 Tax=Kribbella solani TaxID=236067 RepID=UPI00299FD033|nr:ABC-2 family transporter protein [Kribbella solani]MDX2972173.1 ABC-2 family transporter protein [Kribbella solani]